jgi:hypothetical protein
MADAAATTSSSPIGAPTATAPPPTSSVEQAFRPAFDEIARRRAATDEANKGGAEVVQHFARVDGEVAPLDDQRFVLVSAGTAVLAPLPADPTRPSLRVYGAFATKEEAVEHAQEVVRPLDACCSLLVLKRDEWFLLPGCEASLHDHEENARRVARALAAHAERRRAETSAFDREVTEHVPRAPPPPPPAGADEEEDELAEAEALVYKPPRRLRTGGEVRGQSAVVLSVLRDETGGGECLVRIAGCFDGVAEAERWIRNVGARAQTDFALHVQSTCEWFYPNATEARAAREHYRHDELQRIMDAAARNPAQVRSYKEWKREQDAAEARVAADKAAAAAASESSVAAGDADAAASSSSSS